MKVRELIEALQKCNPEAIVIMAGDSEGNGYSPLRKHWEGFYVSTRAVEGYVYDESERGTGESYATGGEPAVVMVPTC